MVDSDMAQNAILCGGMYEYMTGMFGVRRGQGGRRRNRKKRKRCHERNLKRLTKEKNAAKKELRQARRGLSDVAVICELSSRFHTLIRLHNKAKRLYSTPGSS